MLAFRGLLIGAGVILILGLTLMIGAWLSSMRSADRLLQDVSIEQRQLILVTRLEADANALLLDRAMGQPEDVVLTFTINQTLKRYLDLVRIESATKIGALGVYQREEERMARELASLLAGISRSGSTQETMRTELQRLRGLSHTISTREREEAEETLARMEQLRHRATLVAAGLAVVSLCLMFIAGAMLWRGVLRPISGLVEAAARLSHGDHRTRIAIGGVAELRNLGASFNDMAGQIEADVKLRTRELEASNIRLAEIDRSRRLFFSKVSHELRTPVTVMRGEAEVALRDTSLVGTTMREVLTHISANGAFLQRRLDDLLGLARSEDGQLALGICRLDLGAVCREAIGIAAPFARSSEVAIEEELGERPFPIDGDREWLRQALLTIIDNGVKFSPINGRLTLSLRREADLAIVIVRDHGPGVDPTDLARLFDPYFQTRDGRQRGGTGLGLSLARWVVDQHGGAIAAANDDGGGLMIQIALPLAA